MNWGVIWGGIVSDAAEDAEAVGATSPSRATALTAVVRTVSTAIP
ncbi:hypothetical protein CCP2SC5_220046 [Azospirillaceae bacterium]